MVRVPLPPEIEAVHTESCDPWADVLVQTPVTNFVTSPRFTGIMKPTTVIVPQKHCSCDLRVPSSASRTAHAVGRQVA
jgi:hypothetical protein